jgi:gas vesicle protein
MASSRKNLLDRYAELGFRQGDTKNVGLAVRLEIEERKEQYNELKKDIEKLPSEDNSSVVDCNTPYSLVVGELDSNDLLKSKGKNVEATQILETISLRDKKGNDLGNVRFESGSGIGVALSNRYKDTIYIHGGQLQSNITKNSSDISANYTDLLGQIKDLQREVEVLKNILNGSKATKKK